MQNLIEIITNEYLKYDNNVEIQELVYVTGKDTL